MTNNRFLNEQYIKIKRR